MIPASWPEIREVDKNRIKNLNAAGFRRHSRFEPFSRLSGQFMHLAQTSALGPRVRLAIFGLGI
ncbi:MAG: hypothetical protein LDL22_00730, partial [Hyphomicrobiales bacterium]|nr:hypothetical protein [Hyphomicrobiales bacterium]